MPRLKPGQYDPVTGQLKKNPEYESEAKIESNTIAAGADFSKRSRDYKPPEPTVQGAPTGVVSTGQTFADPTNPTAPTVENAALLQQLDELEATNTQPEQQGLFAKLRAGFERMFEETVGPTGQAQLKADGGPVIPLDVLTSGGTAMTSIAGKNVASILGLDDITSPGVGKTQPPLNPKASSSIGFSPIKNTKNAKLTTSYLIKLARNMKNPRLAATFTMGLIGASIYSYPWNAHLQIDNLLPTLQMTARDLEDRGYRNESAEIREMIDDVLDPTWEKKILNNLPLWNVIKTKIDTFKVARISNRAYKAVNEDLNISGGLTPEDIKWDEREAAAIAREEERYRKRVEEEDARYKRINDERQAAEDANFKARAEYFEEREKERREYEEARTAERDAYYAALREIRKYEEEKSVRTYEPPSQLNFGLI